MLFASVPVVLLPGLISGAYELRAVSYRVGVVQNQLQILANHLLDNNYLANYSSTEQQDTVSRQIINGELETLSSLYDGRVMIIDRSLRVVKDTYSISEGKTNISLPVLQAFRGQAYWYYDREGDFIEMATPIQGRGEDGVEATGVVEGVLLTSISSDSISSVKWDLSRRGMVVGIILLCIMAAFSVWLSGVLVRPFHRVGAAISQVKSGFTDEDISVPDYVETAEIVDAFNQMVSRMRVIDQSRQDFVANVSHELKTPLASMKVLADSLLAQESAPQELYREFLGDIVSEIDRENQIITDLLALVKLDKRAQNLHISLLQINELLELTLKRLRPLARKKNVEIVLECHRAVEAWADEVKLTLIFTNLVENAIKYHYEGGKVRVSLDADHSQFWVEVEDNGPGIPREELEHIFERFYRVDKSHSREIGGTGLGLAITRGAVLLHRGSIEVESAEGEGSCFVVRLPLRHGGEGNG